MVLDNEIVNWNERPGWDDYFYEIAKTVAQRASCPRAKCGAVIVQGKIIVGTGYNGAPAGDRSCMDDGCDIVDGHCERANHAEHNALIHARINHAQIDETRIYVYRGNRPNGSRGTGVCDKCTNLLNHNGVEIMGCRDE